MWAGSYITGSDTLENGTNSKGDGGEYDDDNDMSRTLWEDCSKWVWRSGNIFSAVGISLVSLGAFLAAQPTARSTTFCSIVSDSQILTVSAQMLSLVLDSTILIMTSSIMFSDKPLLWKLHTLGRVLILAAGGIFLTWITGIFFQGEASGSVLHSEALVSLAFDGIALALFVSYASAVVPKSGPITPLMLFLFFSAAWRSFHNIASIGRFEALSKGHALMSYLILCFGMGIWLLSGPVSSDPLVCGILVICTITASVSGGIITMLAGKTAKIHPLRTRIYQARTEQYRWERYAGLSQSLRVAVSEYKERHDRDPPPGFDKWYEYAKEKNSIVIDHFEQVSRDMEPFWSLSRKELLERIRESASMPDTETIVVRSGEVTSNNKHPTTKQMEHVIRLFSKHLPDMEIPVNVKEQPRVLGPWDKSVHYGSRGANASQLSRLGISSKVEHDRDDKAAGRKPSHMSVPAWRFRHMISDTCSPNSPLGRFPYPYRHVRDFCSSCTDPQSKAQFLRHFPRSLDLCHQPDLLLLHDHHLAPPAEAPLPKLLPLFSRTKSDAFADIILPLDPYPTDPDLARADNKPFRAKQNRLYWRGYLPGTGPKPGFGQEDLLNKGHTKRLVHMVNNASDPSWVPLLIPASNHIVTGRFTHERISTPQANAILPFDVKHLPANLTGEVKKDNSSLLKEFGPGSPANSMLDSRYILVQDTVSGPPPARYLETILDSNSAPFLATIFREWYTERLHPWVHFVPIDLRWQGIHATLAYFSGLKGELDIHGRGKVGIEVNGRWDDGEWIAREGAKWMKRVARDEDKAIYTFRALLEWGRLLSKDRKGFVYDREPKEEDG